MSVLRALQTSLQKDHILIWGNGRSYSEPRLSTDVLTKLENSVNLILQSVACQYNAVCSRGSCDTVSASSSRYCLSRGWGPALCLPDAQDTCLGVLGPTPALGAHGAVSSVVPAPPRPRLSPVSLLGLDCKFSFFSLLVTTS